MCSSDLFETDIYCVGDSLFVFLHAQFMFFCFCLLQCVLRFGACFCVCECVCLCKRLCACECVYVCVCVCVCVYVCMRVCVQCPILRVSPNVINSLYTDFL